jgi:hypothetical protein
MLLVPLADKPLNGFRKVSGRLEYLGFGHVADFRLIRVVHEQDLDSGL